MPIWPFSKSAVRFEQAVYGSFPFWHRGYDLLGNSPGCRSDWLSTLKETCQRLGERPRSAAPPGGVAARWLGDGTWMVLRPFSPGSDDVGRPDAVAFHAIFLGPDASRRFDLDPFRLSGVFRDDWGADSTVLEAGTTSPSRRPGIVEGPGDDRAAVIAEAIGKGRRAIVEASGPIDALAAQVWRRLPRRLRLRRSLASWAYADAGLFDLIGLPRLTGVDPTDSLVLVVPADPEAASRATGPPGPGSDARSG